MVDYTNWVSWLRRDDKRITVFIHKDCDENELLDMFWGSKGQKPNIYDDDEAHVIMCGNHTLMYRIRNNIYIVPATIKAVVNNNDGRLSFWFDYPKDMKEEGLVKY